jgi:hypothetical protein
MFFELADDQAWITAVDMIPFFWKIKRRFMKSFSCVCACILIVARKRLVKHIPVTTNTYARLTEECNEHETRVLCFSRRTALNARRRGKHRVFQRYNTTVFQMLLYGECYENVHT